LTEEERIAQVCYDGLQEIKYSVGKLDGILRTKIFYDLSETNDLFNQILDEIRKNKPRAEQ
jgi:hypothetical protein